MFVIDISFIIIYLATFVATIFLLHRAGIRLFSVTLPSVAIGSMFIFSFVGLISLYFQFNEYTYSTNEMEIHLLLLLINSYCLITMSLSFVWANRLLGFKVKNNIGNIKPLNNIEKKFIIFTFVVCVSVLLLYLSKVPKIAIVTAILDGANEAKLDRSLMTNDFAGKLHRYNIFMISLSQIVAFTTLTNYLLTRKKSDFILFIASFCVSGFAAVMSTQKGPFIIYILALFLTWCIITKRGIIPIKGIVFMGGISICILISFYIFFMGSSSIDKALLGMFNRAFCGEIIPAYHYLKIFPEEIPFLNGSTFPNPAGIMPYKPFRLTVEVMYKIHPELVRLGIVGSMPTAFWGEAYANFGWFGIALTPIFLGLFIFILNSVLLKLADGCIKIAYIAYLSVRYISVGTSGIFGFVFDDKIIILVIFYFIYQVICHPVWKSKSLNKRIYILR